MSFNSKTDKAQTLDQVKEVVEKEIRPAKEAFDKTAEQYKDTQETLEKYRGKTK